MNYIRIKIRRRISSRMDYHSTYLQMVIYPEQRKLPPPHPKYPLERSQAVV